MRVKPGKSNYDELMWDSSLWHSAVTADALLKPNSFPVNICSGYETLTRKTDFYY